MTNPIDPHAPVAPCFEHLTMLGFLQISEPLTRLFAKAQLDPEPFADELKHLLCSIDVEIGRCKRRAIQRACELN